jgi:putative DNA primase/helicase
MRKLLRDDSRNVPPIESGCLDIEWADALPFESVLGNGTVSEIKRGVEILASHGGTVELCGFTGGKPRWAGYYDRDHLSDLVKAAEFLDQDASGVYVTINPVKTPANNKLVPCSKRTTDGGISRRFWLFLDFDAVRPKDQSRNPSTDEEHQAALETATSCRNWLREQGFPEPILTDSGNGAALFYRIDLPNDNESSDLVASALKVIAKKFRVDTKVGNASRLCRVPGTMNRRGTASDDRPYRMARIVEAPEKLEVVPREKLAALAPKDEADSCDLNEELSAKDFARKYGLKIVGESTHPYGTAFNLSPCPFDKAHVDGSCLIQFKHGGLGFKCHHNGCSGKSFKHLCEQVGHRQPKKADADPSRLARIAIRKHFSAGEHRRIVYLQGSFFTWNEGAWAPLSDDRVDATLIKSCEAEFDRLSLARQDAGRVDDKAPTVTSRLIRDVKACLRAEVLGPEFTGSSTWLSDAYPWPAAETVSAVNGLFNLRTLERREHTPRFFSFGRLGFEIQKDAGKPKAWLKYLDEAVPDKSDQQRLKEWTGYVLSGRMDLQKFLLTVGPAGSGKSVYYAILTQLYGPEATAAPQWDLFGSSHGLELLIGKGLAVFHDATIGGKTGPAVEKLKAIVGEDMVSINPKYKPAFSTRLPTRICINTNEMPSWDDSAGAMVRRALPIAFPVVVKDQDTELKRKLMEELPGIFLWAREGLTDLEAQKWRFTESATGHEMLSELREYGNPVARFVSDRCQIGEGLSVLTTELRQAYLKWCADTGTMPLDERWFGRKLAGIVPGLKRGRKDEYGPRYYYGLALTP